MVSTACALTLVSPEAGEKLRAKPSRLDLRFLNTLLTNRLLGAATLTQPRLRLAQ